MFRKLNTSSTLTREASMRACATCLLLTRPRGATEWSP
jgi:hypothetical protein